VYQNLLSDSLSNSGGLIMSQENIIEQSLLLLWGDSWGKLPQKHQKRLVKICKDLENREDYKVYRSSYSEAS
jgi:hypothetical protein